MLRQFSCTLSLQYILTLAINMSDYKYYGVITFKLITNDLFDSLHCVNFWKYFLVELFAYSIVKKS